MISKPLSPYEGVLCLYTRFASPKISMCARSPRLRILQWAECAKPSPCSQENGETLSARPETRHGYCCCCCCCCCCCPMLYASFFLSSSCRKHWRLLTSPLSVRHVLPSCSRGSIVACYSWRAKALKRAREKAEKSGQSLEELVGERWASAPTTVTPFPSPAPSLTSLTPIPGP